VEGRINYGFHLWTVMNAVFWYEKWIQKPDTIAPASAGRAMASPHAANAAMR
jgi:hypothetical protein